MNALVCPQVLKKIEEANRYHHEQINKNIVKITTTAVAKQKLEQAGITFKEGHFDIFLDCDSLKNKKGFLLKIHSVLGRLKESDGREVIDTRRHIVKINCKSVDYPGVHVSFPFKLPKGSKCKIVKQKTDKVKVRTYHAVVCER